LYQSIRAKLTLFKSTHIQINWGGTVMKLRYLTSLVLILFLFSAVIAPVAAAIPLAAVSSPAGAGSTAVQSAPPLVSQTGVQGLQAAPSSLIGCPVVPVAGIFAAPQAGSRPQDFLIQGTCVEFDQRSEDSQWIRIQSAENLVSRPGWVAAANILLERPVNQLQAAANSSGPAANSTPSTPVGSSGANTPVLSGGVNACLESVNSLNVRSGPGIGYRSVGYLLKGSCVALTARTASAVWVKSDRGWMAVHYLQVEGDLSQLPAP
jgi:hypothetical protein